MRVLFAKLFEQYICNVMCAVINTVVRINCINKTVKTQNYCRRIHKYPRCILDVVSVTDHDWNISTLLEREHGHGQKPIDHIGSFLNARYYITLSARYVV